MATLVNKTMKTLQISFIQIHYFAQSKEICFISDTKIAVLIAENKFVLLHKHVIALPSAADIRKRRPFLTLYA